MVGIRRFLWSVSIAEYFKTNRIEFCAKLAGLVWLTAPQSFDGVGGVR